MSAASVLERLRAKGIEVHADADGNVRVRPASGVTPEERRAIRQHKADIITLVRYRDALYRAWELVALGPAADPEACRQPLADVARWSDEAGEPRATEFRRGFAVEWFAARGTCPNCGGPLHEDGGA